MYVFKCVLMFIWNLMNVIKKIYLDIILYFVIKLMKYCGYIFGIIYNFYKNNLVYRERFLEYKEYSSLV